MLVKRLCIVLVALGMLALASTALAQNDTGKDPTLLDRLDNVRKTIVDDIFPGQKPKPKPPATDPPNGDADTQRAGSVLAGPGQRSAAVKASTGGPADVYPENAPVADLRRDDGTPKQVHRPLADKSLLDDADATAMPRNVGSASADSSSSSSPAAQPLHKRLEGFRQSVFGSDVQPDPEPQPDLQAGRASDAPVAKAPAAKAPTNLESLKPYPTERPVMAQRTRPRARVESSSDAAPPPLAAIDNGRMAIDQPPAANPESNVLFARKGPVLSIETLGPHTITVGKESAYEVGIVNSGEVAAEDLAVFISLPDWAEVAGVQASAGAAQTSAANPATNTIQWKVGYLNAKGRQRLTIRLVPRQSRPFDLAVRWEYKPIASQAMIDVQEPKLALQLEGPREVLYGKKQLYRLKLANTGNGNAENVAITIIPVGAGENMPASHKVGLLTAGEEKILDVELTARQAGDLTIQADARGDGNLHAALVEKVLVRRAGLKVDVDGPKVQYVGAVAAYAVRIRNPGTAPAHNVSLSMAIPAGAKYLSGIEGARFDAAEGKVEWTVDAIGPGVEQSFALKCHLAAAGMSRVRLNVTADDDLATSAETIVQVEAVANLTMTVKDPAGPVPVGDEAVYEVRVRNRGTKEAQGVEVFGYFSRGIEPTSAEGVPNRLGAGQVVFQPIASIAPGEEVVLKIRARAEVPGNHVFRAEAHCKPLNARLISEATNLYYGNDAAGAQTAQEPSRMGPPPAPAYDAMRPIPHPIQSEQTPAPPRR
jgi:uncharacterized repeat protein (TIGR01451 family)